MSSCAYCGAPGCEELFDTVLALDHSRRPPWGPLHGVTVACYLLQHPERLGQKHRDQPWALLNTYLLGGQDAVTAFTEDLRRRNNHRGGALPDFPAAPRGAAPAAYTVTIADVAVDGTFPADGFADRVHDWATATAAALNAV